MNSSKLQSPIILIDPTYKQRNSLASLSDETFKRFQDACKKFLKAPNIKAFELREANLNKIKQLAKNKNYEFILLEARTNKQPGDIAGSKSRKFFDFLSKMLEKEFIVKVNEFDYDDEMLEVAKKEMGKDDPTDQEISNFFLMVVTAEVQRRQAEAAKAEQEAEPTEE